MIALRVPGRGAAATPRRAAPRDAPAPRPPSAPAPARIRRKAAIVLPRPRSSVLGRLLRGVSLMLALAALAGVTAAGSLQVLQSSRTAAAGYEVRTLEQQRNALAAQARLLEADIARMAKLADVHGAAVEQLGMVRPGESVRIAVGVPAPNVVPMPERYVRPAPDLPGELAPWWERMLWSLPGLD